MHNKYINVYMSLYIYYSYIYIYLYIYMYVYVSATEIVFAGKENKRDILEISTTVNNFAADIDLHNNLITHQN